MYTLTGVDYTGSTVLEYGLSHWSGLPFFEIRPCMYVYTSLTKPDHF